MTVGVAPTTVPDEIARAVILPGSYLDPGSVVEPAAQWLRENMPVARAEVEGYDPVWLVSKHADVVAVEKQQDLFHSAEQNPIFNTRAQDEYTRSVNDGTTRVMDTLVYMDPPEHGLHRRAVTSYFTAARIREFEDTFRQVAREAVAELLERHPDGECDFVQDFVRNYPLRIIMTMMGVPEEDYPRILEMTDHLFAPDDPDARREDLDSEGDAAAAEQYVKTIKDFHAFFKRLADERRANPRDDLLTFFATLEIEGERIDEGVELTWYLVAASAGHDTTSSGISAGMHQLIASPEQWDLVKADPAGLSAGLTDEGIRWATPTKHLMRSATDHAALRGNQIAAGERLMLMYFSANRDAEVFAEPFRFDVTRSPNPHMGFGHGPHVCLGKHIAKLDTRVMWEELLPRLGSVELAGEPRFTLSNFVHGLRSLPIRFVPA